MQIKQIITDYIMKSILTTKGDLVVRGQTVPVRLAAVAGGQVFKSAGEGWVPAWGLPSIGDMPQANGVYNKSAATVYESPSLGFAPKLIFALASDYIDSAANNSIGIATPDFDIYTAIGRAGAWSITAAGAIFRIERDTNQWIQGAVSTWGADGFIITHEETGTSGAYVYWFAIG